MAILLRVLLVAGFVFVGYQYFGDDIKQKTTDLRASTYEVVNPEGKRSSLLEDLENKITEVRKIGQSLEEIDLDKIEDPEIKRIISEVKEKVSEGATTEISDIVDDIERLNEKDGPITETISKIVDVILPNNDPTPTPNENEVVNPTPFSSAPAPECNWVCN